MNHLKPKKRSRKKTRTTIKNLYLKYPHKWRDLESKTIPSPYFPASEVSAHPYAMSYKEWKEAVLVLFEEYMVEMLNGDTIYIPHALGRLSICKYIPKRKSVDLDHLVKTGERIYHDNSHTDGYCPILYWNYRYKTNANFRYKKHWGIDFIQPVWSKISKKIQGDFTLINNFQKL
jgi:hypothetical protein